MKNLEHREVKFETKEIKRTEDGRLNIKAYAAVFGNVDSYDDVVERGAFTKTIAEDFDRMKLCVNHSLFDVYNVIGKINELKEDDKGLYIDADILPTTNGKDMAILVENGAINELSIGYRTKNSTEVVIDDVYYRHLTEVKLFEISLIPRAANDQATILSTQRKSELGAEINTMNDEELTELKSTVDTEYNSRVFNILKTN